jgi:hypothetical protein
MFLPSLSLRYGTKKLAIAKEITMRAIFSVLFIIMCYFLLKYGETGPANRSFGAVLAP